VFQCSGSEVSRSNTNKEVGAGLRAQGAEVGEFGGEHNVLDTVREAKVDVVKVLIGGEARAEGHSSSIL
jgi:hypothetical protein